MNVRRIALAVVVAVGIAGLGAVAPAFADGADGFADRTAIGVPETVTGDTTGATTESGEPRPPCADAGASFWFSLTATEAGIIEISSAGSEFDTVLAVYSGDDLATLRGVACNDDHQGSTRAKVRFDAVAGTAYAVQLSGYRLLGLLPDEGAFQLATRVIAPEPTPEPSPDPVPGTVNDMFATPTELTGRTVDATGDLTNATIEAGEPGYCPRPEYDWAGSAIESSIWYRYTAVTDGAVGVSLSVMSASSGGYSSTPRFDVLEGSSITDLRSLACGYVSPGRVGLDPGESLYVRVVIPQGDTYTSRQFSLTVTQLDAPANDDFVNAAPLAAVGSEDRRSALGATIEDGEAHTYYGTIWYQHTAAKSEPLVVSTNRSKGSPRVNVYTGTALEDLERVASAYSTAVVSREASAGWVAEAGRTYWIQVEMYTSPRYPDYTDVDVVLMRGIAPAPAFVAGAIVADGGDRHETGVGVNALFAGGGVVLSQDDSDGDVVDACVWAVFGICVDDEPVPTTPRRPGFPE